MKKSLLIMTLTAFGFAGFAQTFVSTTAENRNVVLEEFTGIYCGYCPDGHLRAQQFYDANPGDVVLVNIHAGNYANPNGSDPDFRTDFGAGLANQSGLCGYPAGTVNREYFPNYFQTNSQGEPCGTEPIAQSRGTWQTTGALVLAESSPVNVAAQASLDLSTGKLTVVVEAYYTGNGPGTTNKLNVAVLQGGVIGPQGGSSANPTQVNPDGTYNHNHMLRHLMTGQWGEAITPVTTGSFFTDTYVWDVPADIEGVPVEMNNLSVVVYIAEGNKDVLTGSEAEMTIVSPNAYDALPAAVNVPEFVCASEITPEITIQNMGNETMTNLTIMYSVNGGTAMSYDWTGSLATAGTEVVTLPAISFTHLPTNTFWVATQGPNGQFDQVASNDIATETFEPAQNSGNSVTITIVPDNYGSETEWSFLDPNGNEIDSGGPYTDGNTDPVVMNFTGLANGCHTFEITDAYGDGICCTYGNGSFTIESNGDTLYTGGEFGTEDSRTMNVGSTNGINDLELIGSVNVFPNPFSDNAQVSFSLVETGVVSLEVYNVLGAKVISENLGEKAAGAHTTSISSVGLESGVYMVNLLVEGSIFSTRVNIAK
jgi:thiol-disulfide isomerase/thioredoxin